MSPSVSRSQQKFMGMVLAKKRGKINGSPEVKKAASSMSTKSAKEFASTKRIGLKEHVSKAMKARVKK